MPAPEIIQTLVKRFSDNIKFYKSTRYNEAQLRQEFLDPFFEALGWDVYNKKNFAPLYREVDVERSISFQSTHTSKTPDYTFRLGEDPKFFVEAKRPSENLQTSSDFAFQLKAYAWNKHLALSILTDFEEFLVFNCRRNPQKSDRPDIDCVMKLTFTDYLDKWDELVSIFSPESIRKGAFDKYAEDNISKKGVTEVDDLFLADISNWRELLARNIALRNGDAIDETGLNYAIQMTIDRIIFLRICEDRGIEPFNQLREITEKPGIYQSLNDLFKRAELKYNSGLFSFKNQKHANAHQDNFTPSLTIDDKVLKEIITHLYYPKRNYNFKAIPVEILGQVYEQFLGKVIRLTPGHMAKIEDKPEVRKAGGVYYTPRYIVDYIVANTVGKLLEGKTPDEASRLRIVDPACGSGSFLLGTFHYLINWHEDWYLNHVPEKWSRGKEPTLAPVDGGGYRISTPEKKRILINNIYGVDIDAQAVEVTKLSLLLKVLEEESGQLSLGFEHALPDLGNNIKCGNSLIGSDYFDGQLVRDDQEVRRVNPFDWHKAFPDVFRQGGFDAVIGNPPYVRQETLGNDKQYYQKNYQVYAGTADLYAYFIERGISLLSIGGFFSYIVANKWMRTNYGEALRKWLKTKNIDEITDFGDLPVFENATAYPCIIRVSNKIPHMKPQVTNVKSLDFPSLSHYVVTHSDVLDQTRFSDNGWSLSDSKTQQVFQKLNENSVPLGEYVDSKIFRGLITGLNEAFVITKEIRNRIISEEPKSEELLKSFIIGRQIKRYSHLHNDLYLILIPKGWTKNRVKRNEFKWLISEYPAIVKHLLPYQIDAEKRGDKGDFWWELRACDYYNEFEGEKIIYPNICKQPEFTLEMNGYYSNQKCYIIPKNDKYLLGLLNSQIMMFFFRTSIPKLRGDFYEPGYIFLKNFPAHKIDFSNPAEVKQHDRMVTLVERMLELHKRTPQTPHEKERLEREIASTDAQIDRLVYDLYALTEYEIKIVEGR